MKLLKDWHTIKSTPQRLALVEECFAAQNEVQAWLNVIEPFHLAKGKTALVPELARTLHVSISTFNRKYGAWKRQGWRAFVNRAKYPLPEQRAGLPPQFLEYWQGLLEAHQRSDSGQQAHRALERALKLWRLSGGPSIPGYSSPPPNAPGQSLPEGWSYQNLMKHQSTKAQQVARRIGPKAATVLLPHNRTTRAGLLPLEEVCFDDQIYDVFVTHPKNPKPLRPVGFNALDTLTGKFLAHTSRLQAYDPETEKRKMLTQEDFIWTVIAVLTNYGFRTDSRGTRFIFEHGTATGFKSGGLHFDESFDEALLRISDGCIRVSRSGRFGNPLHSQMLFRGPGSGNFRRKPRIESMFRRVRTEMSGLPGPTGLDADHCPEETHGLMQYHKGLMELARQLPPDLAMAMRSEFLRPHEFANVLENIYRLIDSRQTHNLEGWDKCGFMNSEWSLDGRHWAPLSNLDALSESHRASLISADSYRMRPLKMSPLQAWNATGACDPAIKRLHPSLIPSLVPPAWSYAIKIDRKGMFSISPRLADKIHFIGRIKTRHGWDHLKPGSTFRAYYNPYSPDLAVITSDAGHYLGVCESYVPPTATDTAAIVRNLGKSAQYAAEEMAGPIRRSFGVANSRLAMRSHNDAIQGGRNPEAESEDDSDLTAEEESSMLGIWSDSEEAPQDFDSVYDS